MNKVTWYSKFIALVLFVALPFIGFWYGIQIGEIKAIIEHGPLAGMPPVTGMPGSGGTGNSGSDYYSNVSEWQSATLGANEFAIAYPIDFDAQNNFAPTPTTEWRVNSNNLSGNLLFTLTIPKAFEPQSNFVDAKLTVGESKNQMAINNCLAVDPSGSDANPSSTQTINGINFTVFKTSDAGAGNLYQTTSYRTVMNGKCVAAEYTIHSSQLGNYPPEYNLQQFDLAKVQGLLDRIIGTVKPYAAQ